MGFFADAGAQATGQDHGFREWAFQRGISEGKVLQKCQVTSEFQACTRPNGRLGAAQRPAAADQGCLKPGV